MIFPITLEYHRRQRVKARQRDDESGGWDSCEPPPVAEILPFDRCRNRVTQGHQPVCARPAAKLSGRLLLVSASAHYGLSDDPLVHVKQHGDVTCRTAEETEGQNLAPGQGP